MADWAHVEDWSECAPLQGIDLILEDEKDSNTFSLDRGFWDIFGAPEYDIPMFLGSVTFSEGKFFLFVYYETETGIRLAPIREVCFFKSLSADGFRKLVDWMMAVSVRRGIDVAKSRLASLLDESD
jgi:hypothetical protein